MLWGTDDLAGEGGLELDLFSEGFLLLRASPGGRIVRIIVEVAGLPYPGGLMATPVVLFPAQDKMVG